ncbi:spermidine synthase [Aliidiomarina celeris]|uniref:spermidine synthase n=1 Tax=Aliidiomarina celeris TaxID=2249428 RepID=UPI000DE90510|nr:hypothetical protein [Aliidiomarina celeris]
MRQNPLTPKQLESILGDATLTALSGTSEVRLVVLENQEYRLLVLNGAIQSVQHKQYPYALLLPHQVPMLAVLEQLPSAAEVLELGLGGGSAMAHARHYYSTFEWLCVESSAAVISLYFDHFAPEVVLPNQTIVMAEAQQWLRTAPQGRQFDLILCDIYAKVSQPFLELCYVRVKRGGWLVINWLPHLNESEYADPLSTLGIFKGWHVESSKVPGYRNRIYRLQRPLG